MTTRFRTYYFDEAILDLPKVIENAKAELEKVEFDTLVGTGFSGGILIPALALSMGKKFVLIRKETDDSHHGKGRLVGELGERWVFVDDFVASGRTRERVITKIADAVVATDLDSTTMVGQYMYQDYNRNEKLGVFTPFDPDWAPEELQPAAPGPKLASSCTCSLCTRIRKGNR